MDVRRTVTFAGTNMTAPREDDEDNGCSDTEMRGLALSYRRLAAHLGRSGGQRQVHVHERAGAGRGGGRAPGRDCGQGGHSPCAVRLMASSTVSCTSNQVSRPVTARILRTVPCGPASAKLPPCDVVSLQCRTSTVRQAQPGR